MLWTLVKWPNILPGGVDVAIQASKVRKIDLILYQRMIGLMLERKIAEIL